jgi:hypothetical protein
MPDPNRFDLQANLILVHFDGCLTDWERRFLEGLAAWRGKLSAKQLAALNDIWHRVQGEQGRGGRHG